MSALILLLLAVCLALLILEDRQVRRDRSELVHVVYVNGIRGKSTVTRMIDRGPGGREGGRCSARPPAPCLWLSGWTERPASGPPGAGQHQRTGAGPPPGGAGRGPRSW